MVTLIVICIYFAVLMTFSRLTAKSADNSSFFSADRRSPWYMVAFGMVGASISGVTFISVPGMVLYSDMTYLQMCMGFIVGYFLVAFVLLPVYYRLNLITIYSYLRERLGVRSYKTGAWFFLLSKMVGAAVRFYIVCWLISRVIGDEWWVLTVCVMVLLIWLYTRRGGIKTLVWTDSFQTLCMLAALVLIIYNVVEELGMTPSEAVGAIWNDSHSKVFEMSDWMSSHNFWKQFLSGVFVVVVMTGLDQDMMQKNLTCKTLREAKKDMCTYAFAFTPVNMLFMVLGILLICAFNTKGISIPEKFDSLLIEAISNGTLGIGAKIFFVIGIVSAAFSSADSSLTALTTTYCVDIKEKSDDLELRKYTHTIMAVLFSFTVLIFNYFNSTSLIDAIFILCGYTYGPLLGLFTFAIFGRRTVSDRLTPYIAMFSPVACFIISQLTLKIFGYKFGYELLLLNGALTFGGLYLFSTQKKSVSAEG